MKFYGKLEGNRSFSIKKIDVFFVVSWFHDFEMAGEVPVTGLKDTVL